MKRSLKDFSGLYPLSKTLRFELIPIGNTKENIERSGILDEDTHRGESYTKVKKIIDRYHKDFIERTLANFHLQYEDNGQKDSLQEYYEQYLNNYENRKSTLEAIQDQLRKQIVKQLTSQEEYMRIDKEDLLKVNLPKFVESNEEELAMVGEFTNFSTYFQGFYQNRRNMYSEEAISTAIAYRLIHDNLPKFVDNMKVFEKMMQVPEMESHCQELYQSMEPYLNVLSIKEMFQLGYYSMVLTQSQIEVYNAIIGGRVDANSDEKIKGLNEYINLYNQKHERSERLPKFKPLFKQILSDREQISWLPDQFVTDQELIESLRDFYLELEEQIFLHNGDSALKNLLLCLSDYDLGRIYLRNDLGLTDISQQLFGNWSIITKALIAHYQHQHPQGKRETAEKFEERCTKAVKDADSYTIAEINQALEGEGIMTQIESYFLTLGAIDTEAEQRANIFTRIAVAFNALHFLFSTSYPKTKNLAQQKVEVEQIKNFLDEVKKLQHFIKPLLGRGDEADKDARFYSELQTLWELLDQVTPLYNKVRSYLTRKPYSDEKIKLNFQNSQLLNGWDLNKETANTSVILRKEGLYYLAIMRKDCNTILDAKHLKSDGECYEKMEYKLLPGANKMLPKVFFSQKRIDYFAPSAQLLDHYKTGTHKKGKDFNLNHCHELIDFFKDSINKHEDWCKFGFQFSDTQTYEDLSGFYREVEQQGYMISFRNVSVSYINQLVADGKLFLFQIYNKDFSSFSKGTPNLHTLYWKMLFDERNLQDVVYKLNGQAEVFFRKSSLHPTRPTHPAGQPIANKNTLNNKKESTFDYDLIKDRRYTVDKFQFHVPITMNFKATGNDNINPEVQEFLRQNEDTYVIGIDRGERHLLYLSLINPQGQVVEQYSLNEIVNHHQGNTYTTNYHDLLTQREKKRDEERKSWSTIESIKELKEGYLSQVVHKIAEMVIKYNAIVVLEDLNLGFMRGRQKVERQVYQKFEKMLIDKLNYLVDKKADAESPTGLLHALQLTSKFESFQKLGKQSGILFYIPAWMTSKMDPTTGFVNLLNPKYESIDKSIAFFSKFDSIRFNPQNNYFEFALDYDNFTSKAHGTQTKWTLCSYGTRIETFRNSEKNSQWDSRELNLSDAFKLLFDQQGIDINVNLKEQICSQNDKGFFLQLIHLVGLMLQMRNSRTGTEEDYLLSPVRNAQGCFFDSRTASNALPHNADANGAYNIARKGLWVIEQIKQTPIGERPKLAIENKEWLRYAQQHPASE